jgi:hypothetical protein
MLSELTPASREEWRRDLQQIRDLGFNTVRTWVEWASVEPRPGEYDFDNLRLLFELAQEVGLRVFIQMYIDSAPDWVGQGAPAHALRGAERRGDPVAGGAGLLHGQPRDQRAGARALHGDGAGRVGVPELPRLGPVERAVHHQLGAHRLDPERAVLLLPGDAGAVPRVAAPEVRLAGRAEPGVAPPVRELGRHRAAALQHDPELHGLHRLEDVHLRAAGRGPGRAATTRCARAARTT